MSYQRLLWHSGLTYRTYCPYCRIYTVYSDYNLGFRAWFPDGFVYCPQCRRPLRHNENNAIKPDGTPYFPFPIRTPPAPGYVAYPIETLALYPTYQQPAQQPVQQPAQQPAQQPVQQQPVQQVVYPQPSQQVVYPQPPQQTVYQPPIQPVQQAQPVQPVQQPEAQPAPPETAEAEKEKCPNCGFEYTAGAYRFCTKCGTKLEKEEDLEKEDNKE